MMKNLNPVRLLKNGFYEEVKSKIRYYSPQLTSFVCRFFVCCFKFVFACLQHDFSSNLFAFPTHSPPFTYTCSGSAAGSHTGTGT
jgi:hypothetical protein